MNMEIASSMKPNRIGRWHLPWHQSRCDAEPAATSAEVEALADIARMPPPGQPGRRSASAVCHGGLGGPSDLALQSGSGANSAGTRAPTAKNFSSAEKFEDEIERTFKEERDMGMARSALSPRKRLPKSANVDRKTCVWGHGCDRGDGQGPHNLRRHHHWCE